MVEYRFWNPRNRQKFSIKKRFYLRYVHQHSKEEIGKDILNICIGVLAILEIKDMKAKKSTG